MKADALYQQGTQLLVWQWPRLALLGASDWRQQHLPKLPVVAAAASAAAVAGSMVLLLADQDLASTETTRQCLPQRLELSHKTQQTLSTVRQLPARSQVAASAAIVQPSGDYAVLAAAAGDLQVWLCTVALGLTVQVFADLAR